MSRYTGPVCRLCRAEGCKLFLKGDRCYTEKCAINRRNTKPGQSATGGRRRSKQSEYGIRLREKQKLRRYYGMTESQFRRFYATALKMEGQQGHNFLQVLERRLDNVVCRFGLATSRAQARQIVRHGHFIVNDHKVDIPSFLVKAGDVISVAESSREVKTLRENAEVAGSRAIPAWLEFDAQKLQGKVLALPNRDQIDTPVTEQLVVEYYAR